MFEQFFRGRRRSGQKFIRHRKTSSRALSKRGEFLTQGIESLEPRLALTIGGIYAPITASTQAYVITLDGPEDLYSQKLSTGLTQFADNSSFLQNLNSKISGGAYTGTSSADDNARQVTTFYVTSGRTEPFVTFFSTNPLSGSSVSFDAGGDNEDAGYLIAGTLGGSVQTNWGSVDFQASDEERGDCELIIRLRNWNTDGPDAVTGTVNTSSGVISLQFSKGGTPFGLVSVDPSYTRYATYSHTPGVQSFTVWNGHTNNERLLVRLAPDESKITFKSPWQATQGTGSDLFYNYFGNGSPTGQVALSAEYINFNADVSASSVTIGAGGDNARTGTTPVQNRITNVSGKLSANLFNFTTDAIDANADSLISQDERGLFRVNSTGNVGPGTTLLFQANDSDIVIESTFDIAQQTYLIQSQSSASQYQFTTTSPDTGFATGQIIGDTVVITMGTTGGTGQIATPENPHLIDLRTRVGRLRMSAASSHSTATPFPVRIKIDEADDLTIDATPSSSAAISFKVGGSLTVASTLATYGSVDIDAGTSLIGNGSITTINGNIDITAPLITGAGSINAGIGLRKQAVQSASDGPLQNVTYNTGAFTGSGVQPVIAGVALNFSERVLIKDQIDASQNGIYKVTSGVATITAPAVAATTIPLTDTQVDIATLTRLGSSVTYRDGSNPVSIGVGATLENTITAVQHDFSLVIDGMLPRSGNQILVKNQATRAHNGVYTVTVPSNVTRMTTDVRVATVAPLSAAYSGGGVGATLTGVGSINTGATGGIDGITNLGVSQRVLVKDQPNRAHNGIYVVTIVGDSNSTPAINWVMTRAQDADDAGELIQGLGTYVSQGNTLSGTGFSLLSSAPSVGASPQNFVPATAWKLTRSTEVDEPNEFKNYAGVRVGGNGTNSGSRWYSYNYSVGQQVGSTPIYYYGGQPSTTFGKVAAQYLSGSGDLPTVDGISLSIGDRVLVKDQASPADNGIYSVYDVGGLSDVWILRRSQATADTLKQGLDVPVLQGTLAGTNWSITSNNPILAGQTPITFAEAISWTLARADDADNADELPLGTVVQVVAGINASTGWTLITPAPLTLNVTNLIFSETQYRDVLLATPDNLNAVYANNTPGLLASTLTNASNAVLYQLSVDGVTVKIGDRILVKSQRDASANGIYSLTTASNVTRQLADARIATTVNLVATYSNNTPGVIPSTLNGTGFIPLIDGVALRVSDRILIKNQTNAVHNGIYSVTRLGGGSGTQSNWQLTRTADLDAGPEFTNGTAVRIQEGNGNAKSGFVLTNMPSDCVVGTNPVRFTSATSWQLTRTADADIAGLLPYGSYIFVTNGALNNNTGWSLGTIDPVELGLTPLNFYSSTSSFIPGNGTVSLSSRTNTLTVNSLVSAPGDTVFLKSTGAGSSITGSSRIVAANAVLSASGNILANTAVASIRISAGADITLDNAGAIDLKNVSSVGGNIAVIANAAIIATGVKTGGFGAGDGNISLTSRTGDISIIAAMAVGDKVTLQALQGGIGGISPVTTWLDWTAAEAPNADFYNGFTRLSAFLTTPGAIVIDAPGPMSLETVQTYAGNLFVTAEGTLTAKNVSAGGRGQVTLNSNGVGGTVQVVAVKSDVETAFVVQKNPVRVATDSNISLLPTLVRSVDGIQLATGDRVLVKNQDNFADNGIYAVNSNGSLSRTIDASASADFPLGMQVIVQAGTQTGVFEVSYTGNSLSLTLGTTPLAFTTVHAVVHEEKLPVQVASVSNESIDPVGSRIIDGITLSFGDRVLLKNQTFVPDNGIYLVESDGSLSRSSDASTSLDLTFGAVVRAIKGSSAGTYQINFAGDLAIGSTALNFNPIGVSIFASTSISDGDLVNDDVDISAKSIWLASLDGSIGTASNPLETETDSLIVSADSTSLQSLMTKTGIFINDADSIRVNNAYGRDTIVIRAGGISGNLTADLITTALSGTIMLAAPGDITVGTLGSDSPNARTSSISLDASFGRVLSSPASVLVYADKLSMLSRDFAKFNFAELDDIKTFSARRTSPGTLSAEFDRENPVFIDGITAVGGDISLGNLGIGDMVITTGGINAGAFNGVSIRIAGEIRGPSIDELPTGTIKAIPGLISGGGTVSLVANSSIVARTSAGAISARTTATETPGVINLTESDSVQIGSAGIDATAGGPGSTITVTAGGSIDGARTVAGLIRAESLRIDVRSGLGIRTSVDTLRATSTSGDITIIESDALTIGSAGINGRSGIVQIITGADTTSKVPSGALSFVNDAANSGLITGAKIQLNAKSPGDLTIRSSSSSIAASAIAGNIVVSQATSFSIGTTGVATAKPVVAASTGNLAATYANNTPGIIPSTLTAASNGILSMDGVTVTLGDRILVKNQSSPGQNGIYAVTFTGSSSTRWRLTRTVDADETAELPNGTAVHVTKGLLNQNTTYELAFVNSTPVIGVTPLVATLLATGYSVQLTSTAGSINTPSVYLPGQGIIVADSAILNAATGILANSDAKTLSATTTRGSIGINSVGGVSFSGFTGGGGVNLKAGGSITDATVQAGGSTSSINLSTTAGNIQASTLKATGAVTLSSAGTISAVSNPRFSQAVIIGSSANLTALGTDSTVALPALAADIATKNVTVLATKGSADIRLVTTQTVTLGQISKASTTASTKVQQSGGNLTIRSTGGNLVVYDIPVIPAGKVLNVGTDNRLKSVTFVVSSNYGDNTTSGSLGKMMGLINTNTPSATQISSLAFSSTLINPLTLTQELPAITRPIKIDGNIRFNSSSLTTETSSSGSGVILSGKSIVKSAAGSAVTPALPINGFTFAAGSAGTAASPSLLTHVTLGGFGSGAAVKLDAANVSVTNSKFGIDSKGKTLANSIGILSSSSGSNSISGNTIGSSTIAGIQVKSGTPTLRGNTLTSNRDGIQVIGGNANLFGNTITTSTNNGITVTGATAKATIGSSTVAADRNIIQSNAVYGIAVLQKAFASIVGNSIKLNSIAGIYLEPTAATAGNNNLAAPTTVSASVGSTAVNIRVSGSVSGSGLRYVDIYANAPTDSAQGTTYLGRITITSGTTFSGTLTLLRSLAAGSKITATLTMAGTTPYTSAFSNPFVL